MEISYHRVDIPRTQAAQPAGQRFAPELVIPRKAAEIWLISIEPIRMESQVILAIQQQESFVRIPLIPYLLHKESDLALAYPLALGIKCAGQIQVPVRRLHIVTGVPVEEVPESPADCGLRYWLGFGFVVQT